MTTEQTIGPWRRPRNLSANARGSIHDDATAEELGFRGGTVAGNIHLVQCVPLLHDRFGDRWFETGTLSVMFRHATVDAEPVRVVIGPTADDLCTLRWELEDGTVTGEGTASIGSPPPPSALRQRDLRPVDPASLTILSKVAPGLVMPTRQVRCNAERQRQLIDDDLLTEPHRYYSGPTPWNAAVASPLCEVDVMTKVEPDLLERIPPGTVGMYGAIELSHHGQPLLLDEVYDVQGVVLAVADTPRTEALWYESTASREGRPIATMLMMSRLIKPS